MSSSAIPPAPPPSPIQTSAAVNAVLTAVAGGDGGEALAKLPLGLGSDREYVETYEGKLIDGKGIEARYLRFYSNGSTESALNEYTEVEISKPIWNGTKRNTKTPWRIRFH